jgi:hypothetical protein
VRCVAGEELVVEFPLREALGVANGLYIKHVLEGLK